MYVSGMGSTSSWIGETCRYTHAANADAVKIRGMIGGGGFEAKIQAFACITSMLTYNSWKIVSVMLFRGLKDGIGRGEVDGKSRMAASLIPDHGLTAVLAIEAFGQTRDKTKGSNEKGIHLRFS